MDNTGGAPVKNQINYLNAKEAAKLFGCTSDYIGKMCRDGVVDCHREGRSWKISEVSLISKKAEVEAKKKAQAEQLSQERKKEIESNKLGIKNSGTIPSNIKLTLMKNSRHPLLLLAASSMIFLLSIISQSPFMADALQKTLKPVAAYFDIEKVSETFGNELAKQKQNFTAKVEKLSNTTTTQTASLFSAFKNTSTKIKNTSSQLIASPLTITKKKLDDYNKLTSEILDEYTSGVEFVGEKIADLGLYKFYINENQIVAPKTNTQLATDTETRDEQNTDEDTNTNESRTSNSNTSSSRTTNQITTNQYILEGVTEDELERRLREFENDLDTNTETKVVYKEKLTANLDNVYEAISENSDTDQEYTDTQFTSGLNSFSGTTGTFSGTSTLAVLNVSSDATFNDNITLNSTLTDSTGNTGTAGYLLQTTGTSTQWVPASTFSISDLGAFDTDDLAEGTNLYFTEARARNTISTTVTGLSYATSTGVLSLTGGYEVPTTASTTEWGDKVSSQWSTSNSDVYYTGGNVGIGTSTPSSEFAVNGDVTINGRLVVSTGAFPLASFERTGPVNASFEFKNTVAARYFGVNPSGYFAIGPNANLDSSPYLLIDGSGNIGVNDTTPSYKLDVNGTGRFVSSLTANSFIKSGGTSSQFLKADGSVDSNSYITDLSTFDTDDLTEGSNLYYTDARFNTAFSGKDTDDLSEGSSNLFSQWSTSGSDVYYTGGKVGIGTTDPTNNLTIGTDGGGSQSIKLNSSTAGKSLTIGMSGFSAYINGGVANQILSLGSLSNPKFYSMNFNINGNGDGFGWNVSGDSKMVLDSDGNVGIGDASPQAKLAINVHGGTDYSPVSSAFDMGIGVAANIDGISGMDFKNFDNEGQVRFMARNNQDDYVVMNMPGSSVSGSWLGRNRSQTAYVWVSAGTDTDKALAVGTLNAGDLVLGTYNTAALTIDTDQNVGIGTTDPSEKLVVNGNSLFGGNNSIVAPYSSFISQGAKYMQLGSSAGSTGNTNFPAFVFTHNLTGTDHIAGTFTFVNEAISSSEKRLAQVFAYTDGAIDSGRLQFGTADSGTFASRMTIDSTGNVGIGTTDPSRLLHLKRSVSTSAGMMRIEDDTDSTYWDFGMTNDVDGNGFGLWYNDGSNNKVLNINTDGEVGIGTTNPQTAAHIFTGEVDGSSPQEALRLEGDWGAAGSGPLLRFTNYHTSGSTPNSSEYNLAGIQGRDFAGNWGGGLAFMTPDSGTSGGSDLVDRMVIREDGNVGIGTDDPQEKLHVYGTGANQRFEIEAGSSYGAIVKLTNTEGSYNINTDNGEFKIYDYTAGTERLTLDSSGNFGIGTTNPSTKLHIHGSTDASFSDSSGLFVIGDINSLNVVMDNNELLARNNGAASAFHFNPDGGDITFGNNTKNANVSFNSSDLSVNGSSGDVGIGLAYGSINEQLEVGGDGRVFIGDGGDATRSGILIDGNEPGDYVRIAGHDYDAGEPMDLILNDAGGNVGIGTNSPDTSLHLYKSNTTSRTSVTDLLTLDSLASGVGGAGYSGFGTGIVFQGRTYKNSTVRPLSRIASVLRDSAAYDFGSAITFSNVENSSTVTDPVEHMRIDYNGNVGIGTTAPAETLHVMGGAIFEKSDWTSGSDDKIYEWRDSTGDAKAWIDEHGQFYSKGKNASGGFIAYNSDGNIGMDMNTAGGDYLIRLNDSAGDEKVKLYAGGDSYFNGGNVGIGTDSPDAKLQVGSGGLDKGIYSYGHVSGGVPISFAFNSGYSGERAYGFTGQNNTSNTQTSFNISALNNSLDVTRNLMTFEHTGNIGIGTTNPAASLHIKQTGSETSEMLRLQYDNSATDKTFIRAYSEAGTKLFELTSAGILEPTGISLVGDGGYTSDGYAIDISRGDTTAYNLAKWENNNGTKFQVKGDGVVYVADELGVGTASPEAALHVYQSAQSSARENLFRASTGESTYSMFGIGNFTSNDDYFLPMFYGFNNDDNRSGLSFLGLVNATNDTETGNYVGAIDYNVAEIPSNSSDPINAARTTLANKTLFSWRSNANPLMIIDAAGNVGIGTNSPSASLEIEGSDTPGQDILTLNANSTTQMLTINNSGKSVTTFLEAGNTIGLLGTKTNSDLRIRTNYVDRMTIDTDGNVGIGTASPANLLHVSGDSGSTSLLQLFNDGTGDASLRVGVSGGNDWSFGVDNSDGDKFKISDYPSLGSNDRLVIDTSGNVGIGTDSPSSKLELVATNYDTKLTLREDKVWSSGDKNKINFTHYTGSSYPYASIGSNVPGGSDIDLQFYVARNSSSNQLAMELKGETQNAIFYGNVGIGTASPDYKLHIEDSAPSGREVIFAGTTADDSDSGFYVMNGTIGDGEFRPGFLGYKSGDANSPLSFYGQTTSANDTGDNALMRFIGGIKTGDRIDGTNSAVSNRPIVQFFNYDQDIMTMLADGNVGIGTDDPQSKLQVSGGSIEIDQSTGIVTTNTLGQEMNIIGSNVSDDILFGDSANRTDNIIFYTGTGTERFRVTAGGDLRLPSDSDKFFFGAGQDASIRYNGSDMVFDSQEVGSGDFAFLNGDLGIGTEAAGAIIHAKASNSGLRLENTAAGAETWEVRPYVQGVSNGGFSIYEVTAGVNRLTFAEGSGNVGIGTGTTAPTEKLDVRGKMYIAGSTSSDNEGIIDIYGSHSDAEMPLISLNKASVTNNTDGWGIGVGDSGQYDGWFYIKRNGQGFNSDFAINDSGQPYFGKGAVVLDGQSISSSSSGALSYYKPYTGSRAEIVGREQFNHYVYDYYSSTWNKDVTFIEYGGGTSGGLRVEFDAKAEFNSTVDMASTLKLSGYGAGTLTTDASGNVTASSDERLKDLQGEFTRGLDDIISITPQLYKWNNESGLETENTYAGFIAQDVRNSIPEAVGEGKNGYLTLQDRPILAASVNAIKELDLRTIFNASTTARLDQTVEEQITYINEDVVTLNDLTSQISDQVQTYSSSTDAILAENSNLISDILESITDITDRLNNVVATVESMGASVVDGVLNFGNVFVSTFKADEIESGKIKTDEICLGETCFTEEEFQEFMEYKQSNNSDEISDDESDENSDPESENNNDESEGEVEDNTEEPIDEPSIIEEPTEETSTSTPETEENPDNSTESNEETDESGPEPEEENEEETVEEPAEEPSEPVIEEEETPAEESEEPVSGDPVE